MFILVTSLLSGVLHRTATPDAATDQEPAGFALGFLHGAFMPTALPTLVLGRNVSIYATRNNGRSYNLGYTLGINACGAIFFGLLYRRVQSLKQALPKNRQESQPNAQPEPPSPRTDSHPHSN